MIASIGLMISSASGAAQQNTFMVTGRVSLPDGRYASRVIVRIEGLNGLSRETYSDDQGVYEFRNIPGGRYRLTVTNPADAEQFTDPTEADTARTAGNRVLVHLFLRKAPAKHLKRQKAGVISVAEAAQQVPKQARKSFEDGLKAKENRKFDLSLAHFDKAIEIFPEYFQALAERGHLHLARNRTEAAEDDFRRALKHNERYLPALRGLGHCKLEQRQFGEAAHHLVRALEVDERDARSHLYLGIALLGLNERALAREALRQALKIDDREVSAAHVYLADIYAGEEKYLEAASELRIYLTANPEAPNAARLKALEADLRARAAASKKNQ